MACGNHRMKRVERDWLEASTLEGTGHPTPLGRRGLKSGVERPKSQKSVWDVGQASF